MENAYKVTFENKDGQLITVDEVFGATEKEAIEKARSMNPEIDDAKKIEVELLPRDQNELPEIENPYGDKKEASFVPSEDAVRELHAQIGQALQNVFQTVAPGAASKVQQGADYLKGLGQAAKSKWQQGTQGVADKLNTYADQKKRQQAAGVEAERALTTISQQVQAAAKTAIDQIAAKYGYNTPESQAALNKWFASEVVSKLKQLRLATRSGKRMAEAFNEVFSTHAPTKQSEVDGSVTKDVDNDLQMIVSLARESVGSPYSPLYWVERMYQALQGGMYQNTSQAFAGIVQQARLTGLSESQEEAIKRIMVGMGMGIEETEDGKGKVNPESIEEATDEGKFISKTDSWMNFPQKQVAAALMGKKAMQVGVVRLGKALAYFNKHKARLVFQAEKKDLETKITACLKGGFSREDVLNEMKDWKFSDSLKKCAAKKLEMPKLALSTRKPFSLSNGATAKRVAMNEEALATIAAKAIISDEAITAQQQLRLSALKAQYKLATPFWVLSTGAALRVAAKLEDGRVLTAAVGSAGECEKSVSLDSKLKRIASKSVSRNAGWVSYCESLR